MSQQTGKCFIYRITTFGYIHLTCSCSESTQPTWSVPTSTGMNRCEHPPSPRSSVTTQHTGTLLHMMSVGLLHESKQKSTWTLMVAAVHVAPPPDRTVGVHFRRTDSGKCSSQHGSSMHMCEAKTIHTLQTKSNIYSSNSFQKETQMN